MLKFLRNWVRAKREEKLRWRTTFLVRPEGWQALLINDYSEAQWNPKMSRELDRHYWRFRIRVVENAKVFETDLEVCKKENGLLFRLRDSEEWHSVHPRDPSLSCQLARLVWRLSHRVKKG